MRRKILASFLMLAMIMLAAFVWITNVSIQHTLEKQVTQSLTHELDLVALISGTTPWQPDTAQQFVEGLRLNQEQRLTIIDAGGVVLADNYELTSRMDNHLKRPEIQEAIAKASADKEHYGVAVRYSETIKQQAVYVAKAIEKDGKTYYLRLSKPIIYIKEYNRAISVSAMVAVGVVAIVVTMMGVALAKWLTEPIKRLNQDVLRIAEGAYDQAVYTAQTDEIGQLGMSFNQMRQSLVDAMTNLETRNAELKAILNSMASGVIAVNKYRRIILINQMARDILNIPEDHVGIQDSMYRIIKSDEMIEMINASIDKGAKATRELFHAHVEKTLRVSIHPIRTEDGDIHGSMIVIEDITQIKRLENMRSEFVSNVSHELKTPLTSILGFVDTLKNGALADKEKATRFLDIIGSESERLNRLITDILLLSEIESANKEPEAAQVNLREVMEEVVHMLQIRIEGKPVTLTFNCDPKLNMIINRDRIKQLMINLTDNAIKYTEKGSVTLTAEREDTRVVIVIADTGIGISDVHKARLFERFYRVDKARSRKVGGTGLGLSIVKHIVNQYRGEILVESEVGKGTRFTVRLPLTRKHS